MARKSFYWRIRRYGDDGVLSEDAIEEIATRFQIQPDELSKLSSYLGGLLDPTIGFTLPMPVDMTKKTSAYRKASKAQSCVNRAIENIHRAFHELGRIYKTYPRQRSGMLLTPEMSKDLIDAMVVLEKVRETLAREIETSGGLAEVGLDRDRRAMEPETKQVFFGIFFLWDRTCGSSFTTDPIEGSRSGPLFDFADTIIAMISTADPPPKSGETLVKMWRKYRKCREVISLWE